MSKREFGHHLKLNHIPSNSQKHVAEHKFHAEKNSHLLKAIVYPDNLTLSTNYDLQILDQGNIGSCVSNSFAGIVQSFTGMTPSRLYLYFNGLIGTGEDPRQDIGLDVLQAIPVFCKYGLTDESNWIYNENKFGVLPPQLAYQNAIFDYTITNTPINQTDAAIKAALTKGQLVIFGMMIYTSFLSDAVAKTGIVPMPVVTKETIEGGHCMHIVGWTTYKDVQYYIIRNSWGSGWGNNGDPINPASHKGKKGGFCFIPSEYILSDVLTFELVGVSIIKE